MKKLAIMFVMLLGSVATMQAQTNTTFDFSCIQASDNFTGAQIDLLVEDSFTEVSPSIFQIASEDGLYSVRVESDGGSILVYIVGVGMITPDGDTLADAIAAAIAAAAVTNPDVDGDGITNAQEIFLNSGTYQFVEVSPGLYQRDGHSGYYVTIAPESGVDLFTMTENDGSGENDTWAGLSINEAIVNANNYIDHQPPVNN